MARVNYQFEKRRRELAKKQKKEQKKLQKMARPGTPEQENPPPAPVDPTASV